jgi:DNA topoisomerase-3
VVKQVAGQAGKVSLVETTQEREVAPLLYSLGSLQREASARFGMKAQAVLDAAQALYEKHKATSYPRTDCEYLPRSMLAESRRDAAGYRRSEARAGNTGHGCRVAQWCRCRFRQAFNDKQITAHHAIIPTRNPNIDVSAMTPTERTIFDMVCRRCVWRNSWDYQYSKTVIEVICEGEKFRVSGKTPLVPAAADLPEVTKAPRTRTMTRMRR